MLLPSDKIIVFGSIACALVFGVALSIGLAISGKAEKVSQETDTLQQRFTMVKDSGGMAFDIYTITDSQTGKTYLVARTSGGVAITPLLP